MEVKFKKSLLDFKYLLMFDLASRTTGVCLWDIQNQCPIKTYIVKVSGELELPAAELYFKLDELFHELNNDGINNNDILVYQEAMPVQLRGGSSTVQTFLSLARSHSVLDLYTYLNNIAIYDYTGVYPISTHSYLKKLRGWDSKRKIEKNDTKTFVEEIYELSDLTFDEADAVFLAKTFVEVKWDKDLSEEIKNVKRHSKELKSQKGINTCNDEIKRLNGLKTALKPEM